MDGDDFLRHPSFVIHLLNLKMTSLLVITCLLVIFQASSIESLPLNGSTSFFGGFDAFVDALRTTAMSDNDIQNRVKNLRLAVFVGHETVSYMTRIGLKSKEDWTKHIILFVSQIQAVFHRSSLKGRLDIDLVKIDFHEQQMFETFEGDRDKLLDSFCFFQQMSRRPEDTHDMSLYISSLDMFVENSTGSRNFVSLGLSPINGVCNPRDNCVVSEFGTTNHLGQPYPSAGFGSTWVASHEMAHNLGVFHDGLPLNECPVNGFIMSSSRGTKGENTWSICSAKMFSITESKCLIPKDYPRKDSTPFKLIKYPGQAIDGHDQCKLFLSSPFAFMFQPNSENDICNNTVYCRSNELIGYYTAGPALEGTVCRPGHLCKDAQCVADESLEEVKGGWSSWIPSPCQSGCLEKSKGFAREKRTCASPKPKNSITYCEGTDVRGGLCDDSMICPKEYHRMSNREYATQVCKLASKYVSDIDPLGEGVQIPHETDRDWRSCSVFCRSRSGIWFTPRLELNHLQDKVNVFFPDGTWCHEDRNTGVNYYCQVHRCLPESSDLETRNADDLLFWNKNLSDPQDLQELRNEFITSSPVLR